MSEPYARDLIGYGANPPHPQWPGDARIAVNFVMNYEEGSEYSFMDNDECSETSTAEAPVSPVPQGQRDVAGEGMFEFGSRVGFWRVMRLFAERNLPLTIFACALALERLIGIVGIDRLVFGSDYPVGDGDPLDVLRMTSGLDADGFDRICRTNPAALLEPRLPVGQPA